MSNELQHKRAIRDAYECFDKRDLAGAAQHFIHATSLIPTSWEAWFGIGVVAKWQCQWAASLEASQRAAGFNPDSEGSWWNIGIAATALGQWRVAREAWRRMNLGIDIPDSDEPLELNLGPVPIRLISQEVVWCRRIDPARAIILNVPYVSREHRNGDLLLHDGEPVGSRMSGGREVPVFNELALLKSSLSGTFTTAVSGASEDDIHSLCEQAEPDITVEDWTTNVRILCKACSEGTPHAHHDREGGASDSPPSERTLGIAAMSAESVEIVLKSWASARGVKAAAVETLVPPLGQ